MNSDNDLALLLGLTAIIIGAAVPFVSLSRKSQQRDIDRFGGSSSMGAASAKIQYSLWRLPGFRYATALLLVLFGSLCMLGGLGMLPWPRN